MDKYSVYGLQYDLNGNIETLERKGPSGDGNGYIDDLTYSYNGNQLIKVEDASGIYNNYDFNNGVNETTEYIYDANGNMTEDKNKSITVEYSYLNLPVRIIFDDNRRIEWTYTASGAKLRKTVYDDGALSYTKDYTGGFVYTNSLLEFFSTQEGRVVNNDGQYEYQYFLKNHLGNVRAAVADNGGGLVHKQATHYYPFGLELANIGMTTDNDNKFKYNAKELEDDYNLYWYHGVYTELVEVAQGIMTRS